MIEPEQGTDEPSRKAEAPTRTQNQPGKAPPVPFGPPHLDLWMSLQGAQCSPAVPVILVVFGYLGGPQVLGVTFVRALVTTCGSLWAIVLSPGRRHRRHSCAAGSFSCLCLVHEGPGDVETKLPFSVSSWLEGLSGCLRLATSGSGPAGCWCFVGSAACLLRSHGSL